MVGMLHDLNIAIRDSTREIMLDRTMPVPGNGDGLLHSYVATNDDRAAQWETAYSIAPRTKAPVVREFVDEDGASHRTLELARWGLHPSWAKDRALGRSTRDWRP